MADYFLPTPNRASLLRRNTGMPSAYPRPEPTPWADFGGSVLGMAQELIAPEADSNVMDEINQEVSVLAKQGKYKDALSHRAEEMMATMAPYMMGAGVMKPYGFGDKMFRAGGKHGRGDATFYSQTKEGSTPFGNNGAKVTEHDTPELNDIFDGAGADRDLMKQFFDETGHPGRTGATSRPFWTTEDDLRKWLSSKGREPDAIMFDEPTGVPSLAIYKKRLSGGQALGKALKAADDLPMDEASRMARGEFIDLGDDAAYEALVPASGDRTVLHDIAQHNAALPVERGGLGLAADNTAKERLKKVYHTEGFHSSKTPDIKAFEDRQNGTWLAETPEYSQMYHGDEVGGGMLPIQQDIRNPFDFGFRQSWADAKLTDMTGRVKRGVMDAFERGDIDKPKAKKLMDDIHKVGEQETGKVMPAHYWWNKQPEFKEILSEAGYDGYSAREGIQYGAGDEYTWSAFKPKQTRSKFAAGDPARKDSANILAGLGAAGLLTVPGMYDDR
jgi:hypothetical protein